MHKLITAIKRWIINNKLLFLILLIASLLRFIGIYPGYPTTHPDETYIYGHALKMVKYVSIDPTRYDYPAFIPLVHAILYMVLFNPLFIIFSLIFAPDNLPNFKNIFYFYQYAPLINSQTAAIFWSRAITAVFGIGVVYLVYEVSKKYFSHAVGLVAAFYAAVNYRQVLNSKIGLPDIYNAFFLLLSFYCLYNLLKKPSFKNYLLSALSLSAFFSTKSQIFPLIPFVVIQMIITWRSMKVKKILLVARNFFKKEFILSFLLIPFSYLIINIYQFIHWSEFYRANYYTTLQYRFGINNLDFYPISYYYHYGMGEIILIFIPLGIIWGLIKYRLNTALLLAVVVPFLYVFLFYSNGGFYTRNFITIIPLLLIFAALFTIQLVSWLADQVKLKKSLTWIAVIIITIAISLSPIKSSIINTYYFFQPWGTTLAYEWFLKNVPVGSKVALRTIEKIPKKLQLSRVAFSLDNVYSLAEMQEEGVDYGYVYMDELSGQFYWWMRMPTDESIRYWNKEVPDAISRDMYPAKVAAELASWSVAVFMKPWQAPDGNVFIVKVPPKIDLKNKSLIKEYSFDNKESLNVWSMVSGTNKDIKNISWDSQEGSQQPGSIQINSASVYPSIVLVTSEPILIKHQDGKSKAYEISGMLKTGKVLDKKERDGYLRVDFYKDKPQKISLTTQSDISALTSRIYGTNEWVEKKVTIVAPLSANYMTVSLGVYNPSISDFWYDDIRVYESADYYTDPRTEKPYLNYYQIPENILFPISHANL